MPNALTRNGMKMKPTNIAESCANAFAAVFRRRSRFSFSTGGPCFACVLDDAEPLTRPCFPRVLLIDRGHSTVAHGLRLDGVRGDRRHSTGDRRRVVRRDHDARPLLANELRLPGRVGTDD